MDDETKELFAYLDALPFAIDTLVSESVIKNQPLGDVSAVNDLLEFIHGGVSLNKRHESPIGF